MRETKRELSCLTLSDSAEIFFYDVNNLNELPEMSFYRSFFSDENVVFRSNLKQHTHPLHWGDKKTDFQGVRSSLNFSKVLTSFIFQADQLVSEKVSGAEHTKLDENFVQMEKITDVFLEVEVSFVFYICFRTIINIYLFIQPHYPASATNPRTDIYF